jgi:hypothetical protein
MRTLFQNHPITMKLLLGTLLLTRFLGSHSTDSNHEESGTTIHKASAGVDAEGPAGERVVDLSTAFPYRGTRSVPCHENGVVAGWCDVHLDPPNLECRIMPEFDMYRCSCVGSPSACPNECVSGSYEVEKTKFGISCGGLPKDEPNYILRESHPLNRCENNGVVAAWCDEFVNPHLECGLVVGSDEYYCKCSGKASNCPTECIDGLEPIEKSHSVVRCKGIPVDQPNYILLEA